MHGTVQVSCFAIHVMKSDRCSSLVCGQSKDVCASSAVCGRYDKRNRAF